ncbi:MAG: hypothetical protein GWP03_05450 [Proteobacteria bacterium]|nr:hypothetical protein [Pseudomonadota bacterium]
MHFRPVRAVFITALLIFSLSLVIQGKYTKIEGNKHLKKQFVLSLSDSSNIYNSLMQSGYFEDVSVRHSGDTLFVDVKEFPLIKEININKNLIFPVVVRKLSPFENAVLNKIALKDTLLSIVKFYNYNGYPEASFDTISANDSILHLHLYQGVIDSIRFFNTRESGEYVRKLLNFKEGDIIDNYTIQSSVSNLLHSGYFYDVKYFIKSENRYYIDFYLFDSFPFHDSSSLALSLKSIRTRESGKILSLTNRFDNLDYSVKNNIYFKPDFALDKWILSVSAMYGMFNSGIFFGTNGFFNHYYSTYIMSSGYTNKNISLGLGAGYDFIRNSPSFMSNIKVLVHNVNYNISYYRYLQSFIVFNRIKFRYGLNHSLTYGLEGEYNYSQLPIPYPMPFDGFKYDIRNYSYLASFDIIYKNTNRSMEYKIGYFNDNLYQTVNIGYSYFSVSISTRFTSGIEHHLSFQYSSVIPF